MRLPMRRIQCWPEGFGNERIDELADDSVTGRIGEDSAQLIN
jgi:hypothetical protein